MTGTTHLLPIGENTVGHPVGVRPALAHAHAGAVAPCQYQPRLMAYAAGADTKALGRIAKGLERVLETGDMIGSELCEKRMCEPGVGILARACAFASCARQGFAADKKNQRGGGVGTPGGGVPLRGGQRRSTVHGYYRSSRTYLVLF